MFYKIYAVRINEMFFRVRYLMGRQSVNSPNLVISTFRNTFLYTFTLF